MPFFPCPRAGITVATALTRWGAPVALDPVRPPCGIDFRLAWLYRSRLRSAWCSPVLWVTAGAGNGVVTHMVTHKNPWRQDYKKRHKKTKKPLLHWGTRAFRGLLCTVGDQQRLITGGAGGIRTRGGFYPTHAFQACDLNRSSTAPEPCILTCIDTIFQAWKKFGRKKGTPKSAF